ncbi:MAG: RluA family pseudouridine synthase [Myxococcota bacterium]|jgi:23S rRNA pseudouridine1911/1915/1917 synthase
MALRRLTVPRDSPPRLDAFLARALPSLPVARIQQLLREGKVRVGGTKAKPLRRVRGGETVELDLPPPRPVPRVDGPKLKALYEDDALLVVDKPAGLVVEPGSDARSLVAVAATQFTGFDVGGLAAPGIAHRLDKETTGCLALAKTDEALAALRLAFEEKRVAKRYLALVVGAPPDEGAFDTPYAKHPGDPRRYTTRVESPRRARLRFTTRERLGELALLDVELDTGRTHQIRVQLSEAGYAVAGDSTYGQPHALGDALGRVALHAARLRIEGVAVAPVDVEASLPADFAALLDRLRRAVAR